MDDLLTNLLVTGILGYIGDISVHITVELDVLDDFSAIGLETAVEVVEVMNARDGAYGGVEELGGNGLREGVIALFLPAADEVVSFFLDHTVEFGNLVG